MTRLEWNAAGERFYEAGVDRGVLYLNGRGVVWNGLISVSEKPSAGDVRARYFDGIKYLNMAGHEEFAATIEAYTYPEEFAECDGTAQISSGLFATQQRRKPFGLVYRTGVGNDIDGINHAYKLHLIYNALAGPSERPYSTLSEEIEPSNFSWELTTLAPRILGRKPKAHFVIDSRYTPDFLLAEIEDLLYGTDAADPRMPSVQELIWRFDRPLALTLDAGRVGSEQYITYDSGHIPTDQTDFVLDGGGP